MAASAASMKSRKSSSRMENELKWPVLGAALSSCTLVRAAMTGYTIIFCTDLSGKIWADLSVSMILDF